MHEDIFEVGDFVWVVSKWEPDPIVARILAKKSHNEIHCAWVNRAGDVESMYFTRSQLEEFESISDEESMQKIKMQERIEVLKIEQRALEEAEERKQRALEEIEKSVERHAAMSVPQSSSINEIDQE